MGEPASAVQRAFGGLGFLCLPWALGSLLFVGGGAQGLVWWRWVLVAAWAGAGLVLWRRLPRARRAVVPWLLLTVALIFFFSEVPSQDRPWLEEQSRTPWAEVDGDVVRFHQVRVARRNPMPSSVDSSPALEGSDRWDTSLGWREESYRVSELEKAYFVVEHFAETEAIAHTMVSFRFTGDRFLVFSVEVRKELDETYSPLRGLFRQYELIYVVADERDALHLRTHVRAPASRVRIHPIDGDSEAVERYFLSLVERVNGLRGRPEFYNTVTSSCTTNLATHLEAVSEHEVAFDKRVYLPGYSSELVWELGLLGDIPLEEALGRDRVTDDRREAASADLEHYSLLIRGEDVPESPQDGSTPVEP